MDFNPSYAADLYSYSMQMLQSWVVFGQAIWFNQNQFIELCISLNKQLIDQFQHSSNWYKMLNNLILTSPLYIFIH